MNGKPVALRTAPLIAPSSRWLLAALAICAISGCGGEPAGSGAPRVNPPAADQSDLPPQPPPVAESPAPSAGTNETQPPAEAPDADPKPDVVRQQAKPGVGVKGKGYGEGFVATPIKAYFSVRERMAFNQIINNMKLFQAQHDRFPESHEEFIKEIIEPSHIELPKLRHDQRFVYDPKQVELPDNPGLMVESPKK